MILNIKIAVMILRIDDVIAARGISPGEAAAAGGGMPPGAGMGGMGGMPPGMM